MENTPVSPNSYSEDAIKESNHFENVSESTLIKCDVNARKCPLQRSRFEPSNSSNFNSDLLIKKNNDVKTESLNMMQDDSGVDNKQTIEEPALCRIFSSPETASNYQVENIATIDSSFYDTLYEPLTLPHMSPTRICNTRMPFTIENQPGTTLNEENDILGLRFHTAGTTGDYRYYHDAWIPSESTRIACINNSATNNKELSTNPCLSVSKREASMTSGSAFHKLKNVNMVYGENLSIENVTEDEHGLRELIRVESYQVALDLTVRLLSKLRQEDGKTNAHSKQTQLSIQIWFTRLTLLVKLGEFQTADIEAYDWWDCDRPNLYYQFYPELYKGRQGTMVPFQMRLLLAVLPSYCERHSEALQRLFSILAIVRKILENLSKGCNEDGSESERSENECAESFKLWTARQKRILITVVNVAVEMQDYLLALEVMNKLLNSEESKEAKQVLHSVMGRIYLRLGDIQESDRCFKLARALNTVPKDLDIDYYVNEALMAVTNNNYQDAYKLFETASMVDPSSIMVMNNCAVCLLFMKHLKEAIRLLVGTIANNPYKALQNSLVLNLCSLFELESSYDWNTKLDLLRLVGRFKGDSVTSSSLKLI